MVRLTRNRKGKTPIDVTIVEQDGTTRIRLTMGDDGLSKKNSDLTVEEATDLMAILNYHVLVVENGGYDLFLDDDTLDDAA